MPAIPFNPSADNSAQQMATFENPKALICELMRQFYGLGWCSGTGGGISIKKENTIYLAPSGVMKERLQENDMFELNADTFEITKDPTNVNVTTNKPLKPSECMHLFELAFKYRNAGAVLHSHGIETLFAGRMFGDVFECSNYEMIKGIKGMNNDEVLKIPIIDNVRFEKDLVEQVRGAMFAFPNSPAVIVRDHGIYIWGDTWEQAKSQAECLHYLFKAVWELEAGAEKAKEMDLKRKVRLAQPVNLNKPRIWKMRADDEIENPKLPNHKLYGMEFADYSEVLDLGIEHWHLDGTDTHEALLKIRKDRDYNYSDICEVTPAKQGREKHDELMRTFFKEHYHMDDEVRYIMNGAGYFDVRSKDQKNWYRIQCLAGDMITLPKGVFHRFTCDQSEYFRAMRLFQGDPVWTPIPIEQESDVRQSYVKTYLSATGDCKRQKMMGA